MAGGQEQRDAAIALRDTFGQAADDISSKAADFHEITADTAADGARAFEGADTGVRDKLQGIQGTLDGSPGAAIPTASSVADTATSDDSSVLSGQDLKAVLDPHDVDGSGSSEGAGHQLMLGGDSATGDVSTGPDEAMFWSGASELKPGETAWPGAKTITTADGKTLLLAGEDNAKVIARTQGKVSLESLIEDRGITMEPWSDDPAVQKTWADISDRYASGVSGDVSVVLGESLRPGNIWETVERGRLESNPAVTSITKIDLKTLERTTLWRRGG